MTTGFDSQVFVDRFIDIKGKLISICVSDVELEAEKSAGFKQQYDRLVSSKGQHGAYMKIREICRYAVKKGRVGKMPEIETVRTKTHGLIKGTSEYFRNTFPGTKNLTVQEMRCKAGRDEVFNQHWLALLATKEGSWFKAVETINMNRRARKD